MPNFILNAFQGGGDCCETCEDVVVEDCGCGDDCPECDTTSDCFDTVAPPYAMNVEVQSSGWNIEFVFVWNENCQWIPCVRNENTENTTLTFNTLLCQWEFSVYYGDPYFTDINFYLDFSPSPLGDYDSSEPGVIAYVNPGYDCKSDFIAGGYNCTNCPNMAGC